MKGYRGLFSSQLVVDLQIYAVCFFRRNHPKTIKMRFMAVSVACIFAIPFLYLMGSFDEVGRKFLFPAMTHYQEGVVKIILHGASLWNSLAHSGNDSVSKFDWIYLGLLVKNCIVFNNLQ